MRLHLGISLMIGFCISFIASGKAYAASFDFTQIAQTSSPFASSVINNAGTVAFSGTLDTGIEGIFTSNGTTITTIASIGDTFSNFNGFSINDSGTVAFAAQLNDGGFVTIPDTEIVIVPGNGIFTSNGITTTAVATIPRMGAPRGFGIFLFSPSINNAGTVVFNQFERPVTIVRTSDGRTLQNRGFPRSEQPLINDVGTIAYIDNLSSITINDGTTDTTLASLPDSMDGEFSIGEFSFNNQGIAAFSTLAFGNNGFPFGNRVLTSNGTNETTIADTNGSFSDLLFPAINDQGTVAFLAELDGGGEGIFTGNDLLNDRVIATGDQLLGSTVTNIGFSVSGLNNSGQIAFFATLANGISGIFRADPQLTQPQPVPEANHTLAILAFGALAASSASKRMIIK